MKTKHTYYSYNKEIKVKHDFYLRFREWDSQKVFYIIIKPRLDSNFVLTVY